jgi:4-deoxy-L-threo-5-hexosulose-uronate ketol-isomerase
MDTRYGANPADAALYCTEELRGEFLVSGLFAPGELKLVYSHSDRMVSGSAVPTGKPLALEAGEELKASYFLERRELGAINIGGPGRVLADGTVYDIAQREGLYLGRGVKSVSFESLSASDPAKFYLNSCPAHSSLPSAKIGQKDLAATAMGSLEECNRRTIRKYIHPDGVKSCQLVMGLTTLEPGSCWNTMPCHTHERRMEVYLYFDLPKDAMVFHFMGRPDETRHLVVRDCEAVISPSWSIHSGCGTRAYSFIWGMAGENQTFSDMDGAAPGSLR